VIVAGRLNSTVGYAAATDLVDHHPHASLAVVDDVGHALPHEQPELLRALLAEWLARVERAVPRRGGSSHSVTTSQIPAAPPAVLKAEHLARSRCLFRVLSRQLE
jgi:hypothetical protein